MLMGVRVAEDVYDFAAVVYIHVGAGKIIYITLWQGFVVVVSDLQRIHDDGIAVFAHCKFSHIDGVGISIDAAELYMVTSELSRKRFDETICIIRREENVDAQRFMIFHSLGVAFLQRFLAECKVFPIGRITGFSIFTGCFRAAVFIAFPCFLLSGPGDDI